MITEWKEKHFHKGVGKALKIARKRAGLRQEDIADVLGVGRTSITNMERGYQPISLYQAALLIDVLPEWRSALNKRPADVGVVCPHLKEDFDYICARCGELVQARGAQKQGRLRSLPTSESNGRSN